MHLKSKYSEIKANKIILIGNGLDLALGLKTSYQDFLLWLLKNELLSALRSGEQDAPFPKYKGRYDQFIRQYYARVVFGYSSNKLFDILLNYSNSLDEESLDKIESVEEIINLFNSDKIEINFTVKNGLFEKVLRQCNAGWVDIESEYFDLLKSSIHNNEIEIDEINSELNELKSYLEKYLSTIEFDDKNANDKKFEYLHQFFDGINEEEFLETKEHNSVSVGTHYFVNFNYTNALKKLIESKSPKSRVNYKLNYIHGELNSKTKPIIFGFGDEMDVDYKKIEELKDNRYFEHIKSFKYFGNSSYRELMRFLDNDYYQVCIYGHSCGLSDRIMLNEIFEHENCKSIKVFFHEYENGQNDFINKTMEISRHFTNNKLMRKKIVEFNTSNKIPQTIQNKKEE